MTRASSSSGSTTGRTTARTALTPGKPRHQAAAAYTTTAPTGTAGNHQHQHGPWAPAQADWSRLWRIDSCPQSAGDGTQITAGLPLELGRWRDPEQPQPPPRLPGDRAAVLPKAVHPHRPAALLDPAGDGLEHHLRGLGLGDQGGDRRKAPARRPLLPSEPAT